MITREFNLYLHAGHSIPLVINVNQYDQGEQWLFTLFNADGTQYTPSSGAIVGIKSDNLGIINSGTVDSQGRVVINETQQMTAAVGKAVFELLIDDQTHGTANFIVLVEPKPGDNADLSESDYSLFQQAIDGTSATAIAEGVADWMDENLTPTTPVVDASLTVQGAAADSAKVGQELSDLKSQISTKAGLSEEAKQALLACFEHIGGLYTDANARTYIANLRNALYPPTNLTSISAVYVQSGTVYDTDALNSLKADLVVTAHYSDSRTQTVTDYSLSGTLSEGTSEITVSYGGKTTTFNVTVTADPVPKDVYQKVEWVGTTKRTAETGPYINTGLTEATKADINGYEIDVSAVIESPDLSEMGLNPILGWGSAAACYFGAGTSGLIGFRDTAETAFDSSISAGNKYDFHVYWNSTGGNATANQYSCSRAFSATALNNPVLSIGTGFYAVDSSGAFKIYGNVLVKKNSTIVGNFYPCYRKSDNAIGFYDTVSENFYTNAGTGSFEKGGDI